MKKIIFFHLVLCGFIFNSCVKKLAPSDADFVGKWWNETNTFLTIDANGHGVYDFNNGTSTERIEHKVIIDGSTITFKALGIKKEYSIDKRPFQESGRTKMVLSGVTFKLQ